MAAIDNISHINALKELMKIIEEDEFLENISDLASKVEVLKIFKV